MTFYKATMCVGMKSLEGSLYSLTCTSNTGYTWLYANTR